MESLTHAPDSIFHPVWGTAIDIFVYWNNVQPFSATSNWVTDHLRNAAHDGRQMTEQVTKNSYLQVETTCFCVKSNTIKYYNDINNTIKKLLLIRNIGVWFQAWKCDVAVDHINGQNDRKASSNSNQKDTASKYSLSTPSNPVQCFSSCATAANTWI